MLLVIVERKNNLNKFRNVQAIWDLWHANEMVVIPFKPHSMGMRAFVVVQRVNSIGSEKWTSIYFHDNVPLHSNIHWLR